MIQGSVFYDPQFLFHDGELGQKLFVLLNDGQDGSFLTVLTTTKQKGKSGVAGCHAAQFPANFHFPAGSDFPNHTWLLLDEIYEFIGYELGQKIKKSLISQKLPLSKGSHAAVLDCAVESEDISTQHRNRLLAFRESLKFATLT